MTGIVILASMNIRFGFQNNWYSDPYQDRHALEYKRKRKHRPRNLAGYKHCSNHENCYAGLGV